MGSSRYVDIHDYFDQLLSNIYEYQKLGKFCIMGDFNARISDVSDYIEGVDNLPCRNVVDFTKNTHGDIFCDFLVNSNCCVLNGRHSISNDFTCISSKGMSVVDYIIVPYEDLSLFSNFEVTRVSEIAPTGTESRYMPDHSLLSCLFDISMLCNKQFISEIPVLKKLVTKYDTNVLPEDFCQNTSFIEAVDSKISLFESNFSHQSIVDDFYNSFSVNIKDEMSKKLPKSVSNVIII